MLYSRRLYEQRLEPPPEPPEGALEWVGCWRFLDPGPGLAEVQANLDLWGQYLLEDFERLLGNSAISTDYGKSLARSDFAAEVEAAKVAILEAARGLCVPGEEDDPSGGWSKLFEQVGREWDAEARALLADTAPRVINAAHIAEVALVLGGAGLAAAVAALLLEYAQALIPALAQLGIERIRRAFTSERLSVGDFIARAAQAVRTACRSFIEQESRLGIVSRPGQVSEEEAEVWQLIARMRDTWKGVSKTLKWVEEALEQPPQDVEGWDRLFRAQVLGRIRAAAYQVIEASNDAVEIAEKASKLSNPTPQLKETVARMLQAVQGLQRTYVQVTNTAIRVSGIDLEAALATGQVRSTVDAALLVDQYLRQYMEFLGGLVVTSQPAISAIAERLASAEPESSPEELAERGRPEVEQLLKGQAEAYLEELLLPLSGLSVAEPPTGLPMDLPPISQVGESLLERELSELKLAELPMLEALARRGAISTGLYSRALEAVLRRPMGELAEELDRLLARRRWELWQEGLPAGALSRLDGHRLIEGAVAGSLTDIEREVLERLGLSALLLLEAAPQLKPEDSTPGNPRLDFMEGEPDEIPMHFVLWTHVRGIEPEHKDLSCDQLAKLPKKEDTLNIHHDLRIRWRKGPDKSDVRSCYLEGLTIFLGTQENWDDMVSGKRTKFAGDIKAREACAWNDKEIIKRHFPAPPQSTGNKMGKRTWAQMCFIDEGYALPLRIRNEKGRRYYELALWFKKYKGLNGIWGVSEEAAAGLKPIEEDGTKKKPGFLIFKLKTRVPFCERQPEGKHKEEIKRMPEWQRYTREEVEHFLRTGKLKRERERADKGRGGGGAGKRREGAGRRAQEALTDRTEPNAEPRAIYSCRPDEERNQ